MKKKIFLLALSLCVLAVFACALVPASAEVETPLKQEIFNKALISRFNNMLNRNFAYNTDFENADILTDNSVLALLDKREGEDSDYISDVIVKGFVQDMYGIEIIDINEEPSVHKTGFVYITPRGFTTYKHIVTDITENEDGSFTVYSQVKVNPHDDESFITTAETLFVPNRESSFGYNIIYSNLTSNASGI